MTLNNRIKTTHNGFVWSLTLWLGEPKSGIAGRPPAEVGTHRVNHGAPGIHVAHRRMWL